MERVWLPVMMQMCSRIIKQTQKLQRNEHLNKQKILCLAAGKSKSITRVIKYL